jgi:pimeloyl-ACP methyl ester carboxylesterase
LEKQSLEKDVKNQLGLAANIRGNSDADRLAVLLPGLVDTKDYPHMRDHVERLSRELGCLAISFDPPGTWDSEGSIGKNYTVTNYLEAIDEVIEFFDQRETLLAGHSLGGRLAFIAADRNPNVTAVASLMSAADFVRNDNYRQRVIKWEESGEYVIHRDEPVDSEQLRQFRLPYAFSKDAQTYSAGELIRNLSVAKLFVAGEYDQVVPPETVQKNFESAEHPRAYRIVKSDHDYRQSRGAIRQVGEMVTAFFRAPSEAF